MLTSGDTIPLLIGTLEQPSTGDNTIKALTFFVEDVIVVPKHKKTTKDAIAHALGCEAKGLLPIATSVQKSGR